MWSSREKRTATQLGRYKRDIPAFDTVLLLKFEQLTTKILRLTGVQNFTVINLNNSVYAQHSIMEIKSALYSVRFALAAKKSSSWKPGNQAIEHIIRHHSDISAPLKMKE